MATCRMQKQSENIIIKVNMVWMSRHDTSLPAGKSLLPCCNALDTVPIMFVACCNQGLLQFLMSRKCPGVTSG